MEEGDDSAGGDAGSQPTPTNNANTNPQTSSESAEAAGDDATPTTAEADAPMETNNAAAAAAADDTDTYANKDPRRRVKLYVLNEQRSWDDKGTGHVTFDPCGNKYSAPTICVLSENDDSTLLESKVSVDTAYQKQQETLIVWSEDDSCDLALSFQEKAGCDDVWHKICKVQNKDPSVTVTQPEALYDNDGSDENDSNDSAQPSVGGALGGSVVGQAVRLPEPLNPYNVNSIYECLELVQSCMGSPLRREALALAIEQHKYVPQLLQFFTVAEELENVQALKYLYQVIKHLLMLNKSSVLEMLIADDAIKSVVGALEYDPSCDNVSQRKRHRNYLWNEARFKEVIPFSSNELRAKIHQTYRVQYIQDVILPAPSIFEENMLQSVNTFVFFSRVEIVGLLQEDQPFLDALFGQLRNADTPTKVRRDLTLFLREFCTFAQTLQPNAKDAFFKMLQSHSIWMAVDRCLNSSCSETRATAVEITAMLIDYSAAMARAYMLQQSKELANDKEGSLLINLLIRQLFSDTDPELSSAMQLVTVLRLLLDPESLMANPANKTEFLSFFYKHAMHNLCQPLLNITAHDKPGRDDYHTAHTMSLILELLCFCIEHHSFHVRTFTMHRDLLRKVLVLLQSRHAFLALGALRLLRKVVQLKDDFYYTHMIRHRLFEPVVRAFLANGHKYNLINSACLELFEFIRTEEIRRLIEHIGDHYLDEFDGVKYVSTFVQFRARYDQIKERERTTGGSAADLFDRYTSFDVAEGGVKQKVGGAYGDQQPQQPISVELDSKQEEKYFQEDEDWDDEPPTTETGSRWTSNKQQATSASQPQQPPRVVRSDRNSGGGSGRWQQQQAEPDTITNRVFRNMSIQRPDDDDDDANGPFAAQPLRNKQRRPKIAIKTPVLSSSSSSSTSNSGSSNTANRPQLLPSTSMDLADEADRHDQVVSSTTSSPAADGDSDDGALPSLVVLNKPGASLVDYDCASDSDSDEDSGSKDASGSPPVSSTVQDDDPRQQQQQSTTTAATAPTSKKRLKYTDDDDDDDGDGAAPRHVSAGKMPKLDDGDP